MCIRARTKSAGSFTLFSTSTSIVQLQLQSFSLVNRPKSTPFNDEFTRRLDPARWFQHKPLQDSAAIIGALA